MISIELSTRSGLPFAALSLVRLLLASAMAQQQGTVKRYYVFAGDKLFGEVQGGLPQVAYTWGPEGLVSQRLFRVAQIAFDSVIAGEVIEAPLSQVEDESDQSGYASVMNAPPYVIPIPLGDLTLWYHHGPQGETRYLTDESGAITDTYLYDAYGRTISTTGSYYNPHRYGGRFGYHTNLNASGLILAGQRWYSPALRRWISRDPIGYEGDDNLYEYVGGRPVIWVDPSGLKPGDWWDPRTHLQTIAPFRDLYRGYQDMRRANFIGADKYFHCRAHCEATSRGPWGQCVSSIFGNGRELLDFPKDVLLRGTPIEESLEDWFADDQANSIGRAAAAHGFDSCVSKCLGLAPAGFPERLR